MERRETLRRLRRVLPGGTPSCAPPVTRFATRLHPLRSEGARVTTSLAVETTRITPSDTPSPGHLQLALAAGSGDGSDRR